MLHAILQSKTNFLTASYNSSDRRFEDPITSIVFGPLEYIPAQESFTFFTMLFEGSAPVEYEDLQLSLTFWHRLYRGHEYVDSKKWDFLKMKGAVKQYVEPDLLLEYFTSKGLIRRYMIEIKWDSPEGKDELKKQWGILKKEIKDDTIHIFLAKVIPDGLSRNNVTKCHWNRFVNALHSFCPNTVFSPAFDVWRGNTIRFLEAVESKIKTFSGFSRFNYSPQSIWHPVFFDTAIILNYYNLTNNGICMNASNDSIIIATEMMDQIFLEIAALEREVNEHFDGMIPPFIRKYEMAVTGEYVLGKSGMQPIEYYWQHDIYYRNERSPRMHVAFLISLSEKPDAFPNMNVATLHVMFSEYDVSDYIDGPTDIFGWQVEANETANVELPCDAKLQIWEDGEAYLIAVPLSQINCRDDIMMSISNPLQSLFAYYEDGDLVVLERAFRCANQLLRFEPYALGVRVISA